MDLEKRFLSCLHPTEEEGKTTVMPKDWILNSKFTASLFGTWQERLSGEKDGKFARCVFAQGT